LHSDKGKQKIAKKSKELAIARKEKDIKLAYKRKGKA